MVEIGALVTAKILTLRNYAVALIIALVMASFLYIKIDVWLNFRSVPATVTSFKKLCRVSTDIPDLKALLATAGFPDGKPGSCDTLAELFGLNEHTFHMRGRHIELMVSPVWKTSVSYVSPVDGKVHESVVSLGPKDGEDLRIGKVVTLLASKRDADLLQEP